MKYIIMVFEKKKKILSKNLIVYYVIFLHIFIIKIMFTLLNEISILSVQTNMKTVIG